MTSVNTVAGSDDKTLCNLSNADDSLCTDEFEIISSDTLDNGDLVERSQDVSQWSIQHSINVESLVPMNNLASLLFLTHNEEDIATLTSVANTAVQKNTASSLESLTSVFPAQSTLDKKVQETPVLVGTMEQLPSLAASTVTDASTLADSDATLEDVLRSQSETREMLEKAIVSLDSFNREKSEMSARLASITSLELEMEKLKNRITELEKENDALREDRERKNVQANEAEKYEAGENSENSKLEKNVRELQQELLNRGLEVDARTKALVDATNELEFAYRKIADLTDSRDTAELERIKLSDKLDETFALLVAERERTSVTEDHLRSLKSSGGDGFNLSLVNEKAIMREMREKADYARLLESELQNTRKRLDELTKSCESKDLELRTHEEIINVLKEEDMEGRRVIAEKNRKISELEEMVRSMGLERAEVNNC